ncbi:GNAT family N-acetyltransferase [Virgibacillus dakarensis]|nr:GNAT family N-acetyltransferase [Virgibacillus dakarensis]
MINISRVNKKDYPNGKKVIYQYRSDKYYDISITVKECGWKIDLVEKNFEEIFEKHFEGEFFEVSLPQLECYIAELHDDEVGVISFNHEKWNNVLRIWDIHVEKSMQKKGIGSRLIEFAKKRGKEMGVRAVVLETQTSNFPAIQFYRKHGFKLTGFDVLTYSNNDVEKKEVRIEMGHVLE